MVIIQVRKLQGKYCTLAAYDGLHCLSIKPRSIANSVVMFVSALESHRGDMSYPYFSDYHSAI